MPFIPFQSLDPEAPPGHPAPVLWLRAHRRAWAFPPTATAEEIDAYALWLHVHRLARELAARERSLRPPFLFRVRLFLHRLRFFYQATGGSVSPEAARDLQVRDGTIDEEHDQ